MRIILRLKYKIRWQICVPHLYAFIIVWRYWNLDQIGSLDICRFNLDSLSIYLNLEWNSFLDPIPASLGRLSSSLIQLSLGLDHLNGSIPKSFGQLSNLEVLDVSDDKLCGMVSELHFANLRHLTGLILSSNSFVIDFAQHGCLRFSFKVSGCRSQFPQWLQSSNTKECWNFRNV